MSGPPEEVEESEEEFEEFEEVEEDEKIEFPELIAPLSTEEFIRTVWGKAVFASKLSGAVLEKVMQRFDKGELASVLPTCRKDDNTTYTPEEMQQMESEYEEHRKTLNLPLCFAPGADDIRESFVEHCGGLGNDVEVGVYCSRPGGETAVWHSDNNHNITIQLLGEKEWSCAPGSPHTVNSKGLMEAPKNRFEQTRPLPTVPQGQTTYLLRAGSVIYLPPGHWHAVAAVGKEDSFSIDLRIGNVLRSKWLCEAVFSSLLATFSGPGHHAAAITPEDLSGASEGMKEQLAYLLSGNTLERIVSSVRIPRCFPFQRELSNGLHKRATLKFLASKGFVAPESAVDPSSIVICINDLVSVAVKQLDADRIVIEMRSESSLSTMEYLRCGILCPAPLLPAVSDLAARGAAPVSSLVQALGPGCDETAAPQLRLLLRVLLHANVLYVSSTEPPSQPLKKRKILPGHKRR